MKVLFINPSQTAIYGGLPAPLYSPLGLGYLAAVLLREGHEVQIIDIDAERIREADLKKRVIQFHPSLIGVTTPFPATELYSQGLREGVIPSDYWRGFAQQPEKGVVTKYWEKELTKEELFYFLNKFYKKFYGRPFYILKQFLKIRSSKNFIRKIRTGLKILR